MRELLILFGQIWSGKTSYAKHLSKMEGYKYFDFDDNIHFKSQKVLRKQDPDITLEQEISHFINLLVDFCSKNEKVVVDGWFSWTGEWETKNIDNKKILEELKNKLSEYKVSFRYCVQDLSIVGMRYINHNRSDTSLQKHTYKVTCRKRKSAVLNSGIVFDKFIILNDNWSSDYVEINKEIVEQDYDWV